MLGRNWRLRAQLAGRGYRDLREVPEADIGEGMPLRIWRATHSGDVFVDPQAAALLRDLAYPRYYLDFETIQFAVPIWAGTRPYEQLPFQWSCHIEHADESLAHREFLDIAGDAPMLPCMLALIDALGSDGPVFTYSAFERTVLRGAAVRFPALASALGGIIDRIVDLLTITAGHYYHPAQKGSWSIKAVLPTIAPSLDYENLGEVADGGSAQRAYLEIIGPQTPPDRKDALAKALRSYCRRDTEGMIRIAQRLMVPKGAETVDR
jgi:hypothetical protein